MLKVEHMRDFRVKRLRRLLGCSLSEAVGIVSYLVLFVCDHGGGDGGGSFGERSIEDFADLIEHKGDPADLAEALIMAEYLRRDDDEALAFRNWERFEPKWARDARLKREQRATERRGAPGRTSASSSGSASGLEEHTHTLAGESDCENEGCDDGACESLPFPAPGSVTPAPGFPDGTHAPPIEQGEGPRDWPQVTTPPDALAWGPHGFVGAHASGGVRARIAKQHPIALDLDEWDRLVGEATEYLRAHPDRVPAPGACERWLRDHWIARDRPPVPTTAAKPGAGAKRSRDGPSAEERKAKSAAHLERRRREREATNTKMEPAS